MPTDRVPGDPKRVVERRAYGTILDLHGQRLDKLSGRRVYEDAMDDVAAVTVVWTAVGGYIAEAMKATVDDVNREIVRSQRRTPAHLAAAAKAASTGEAVPASHRKRRAPRLQPRPQS